MPPHGARLTTVLKLAFRMVDVVSDCVVKFLPIHLRILFVDSATVRVYERLVRSFVIRANEKCQRNDWVTIAIRLYWLTN